MKRLSLAVLMILTVAALAFGGQKEVNKLMKYMRVTQDSSGSKRIYDESTPKRLHNNMCYIYLRQKDGKTLSRIVFGAQCEEGSTLEKVTVINTLQVDVPFMQYERHTDFTKNKMFHYLDVDGEYLQHVIWAILQEDKPRVEFTIKRYTGERITYTFRISKKQLQAIDRVQKLYGELI